VLQAAQQESMAAVGGVNDIHKIIKDPKPQKSFSAGV
jgi:hypothetical protein